MEKILEYQKLDTELFRLEREINKNEHKKNAQAMVSFVKEAQNQILELDKNANKLCDDFQKLKQVQEKGISLVDKYSRQFNQSLNQDELKDLRNKLSQTGRQLKELENRLLATERRAKQLIGEFDALKKKTSIAKSKHQESKSKFDEYYTEKEPEIKALKDKMAKLEKDLDSSFVSKYKTLKQDGVFPIVVKLIDSRCGGCRMELPSKELEKIRHNGKLECPSCHRLIYIEKAWLKNQVFLLPNLHKFKVRPIKLYRSLCQFDNIRQNLHLF